MAKSKTTETDDKGFAIVKQADGTVVGDGSSIVTVHDDGTATTGDAQPEGTDDTPNPELNDEAPAVEDADTRGEEIAARTTDTDKESAENYTKIFVLGPGTYTDKTDYDHTPNKDATRQCAIANGLHPTGDVKFVSNKLADDKHSRVLTYEVPVQPAHNIVIDEVQVDPEASE